MKILQLILILAIIIFPIIGGVAFILAHISKTQAKKKIDHLEQYLKESFPEKGVINLSGTGKEIEKKI